MTLVLGLKPSSLEFFCVSEILLSPGGLFVWYQVPGNLQAPDLFEGDSSNGCNQVNPARLRAQLNNRIELAF